jgi:hypothetical protein
LSNLASKQPPKPFRELAKKKVTLALKNIDLAPEFPLLAKLSLDLDLLVIEPPPSSLLLSPVSLFVCKQCSQASSKSTKAKRRKWYA